VEFGAQFLAACGAVCFDKNRRPNGGFRGPILRDSFFRKCIFGPDLLQFYEGYFYYKYKFCIEFVSWQQTLGFEG